MKEMYITRSKKGMAADSSYRTTGQYERWIGGKADVIRRKAHVHIHVL